MMRLARTAIQSALRGAPPQPAPVMRSTWPSDKSRRTTASVDAPSARVPRAPAGRLRHRTAAVTLTRARCTDRGATATTSHAVHAASLA